MLKDYVPHLTLTFNLMILFLQVTYCPVMIIIYAKLFLNPTMQEKTIRQSQICFTEAYAQGFTTNCDPDLSASDKILV